MKKYGSRRIRTRREPSKVFLSVLCFALAGLNASADTLTWDPDHTDTGSAGTGFWSDAAWANGSSDGVWVDGNDATIGGTAASAITLDQNVSGGTLTFNNTGGSSTITGESHTLFFDVYNVSSNATVDTVLNWVNGFTLSGGGTLDVLDTYSGTIGDLVIDNGTLNLRNPNTFNGGSITVNAGGVLKGPSTSNGILQVNSAIYLNGGRLQGGGGSNGRYLNAADVTAASGATELYVNNSSNQLNITNLKRTTADISTGSGGASLQLSVGGNTAITIANYNGNALGAGVLDGWAVYGLGGQDFAYNTGTNFEAISSANDLNYYLVGADNDLNSALATSDVVAQDTGGTISSDKTIHSLTYKSTVTVNGLLTITSGGIIGRNSGNAQINGSGSLTSGLSTGELFVYTPGTSSINVAIVDNGSTAVSLIKGGAASLTLGAQSAYSGGTFINQAELKMGVANALPLGGDVVLADRSGAQLNLNSYNQEVGALWGGGSKGGKVLLGSASLTVRGNADGTAIYRGAITGSGKIIKNTTNIQTLSGANNYTGDTDVDAGKLFIAGTANGITTVAAGAVLGIGEQNAVGSFSTAQVALTAGTTAANSSGLAFALGGDNLTLGTAGVNWSQLTNTADGGFYIDGPEGNKIILSLSGVGLYGSTFDTTVNHEWDNFIITGYTGDLGGDPESAYQWENFFQIGDVTGLNGALAGSFSVLSDDDGNLDLYYTAAVPEPSTWVLLAGGAGLLLFRKRRRAALAA